MLKNILTVLIVSIAIISIAQKPIQPNSAEIFDKIQKLDVLGTVLYIAAHPDDENQRLISYMANKRGMHTTYLSLTRGDGGQNLLGTEIREQLGVIRTQELLQARSIDGGHQRFTRAIDFGYSKHPDETFDIWNKEDVLSDVVYTIRELQPDVIINRFDHRTPGKTHGHHTGSAMLGVEAYNLSGDSKIYPEQLDHVDPWKASSIYMNTSWWFYGSKEKFAEVDKSNLYSVDIGVYYPLLGKSNTEISQEARSMHKCQGFGATGYRGSTDEWMEFLDGEQPQSKGDIFKGTNTTWSRIDGGENIQPIITELINNYSFSSPPASVPQLITAYKSIAQLKDSIWKKRKLNDIKDLILDCLGLYMEVKANAYSVVSGDSVTFSIEAINRSNVDVDLIKIKLLDQIESINFKLEHNIIYDNELKYKVSSKTQNTSPFWLKKTHGVGSYSIELQELRNKPIHRELSAFVELAVMHQSLSFELPLVHKWNDPVDGERYRPFEVTPPVSVALNDDVFIFKEGEVKEVKVAVQAWQENFKGQVSLTTPLGWKVSPPYWEVDIPQKGESKNLIFTINHTDAAKSGGITTSVKPADSAMIFDNHVQVIKYDHIPTQTMLTPATSTITALDIQSNGQNVGYIMGAGDEIPEALRIIGCTVDLLQIESISVNELKKYDAVVVGIRAFNTVEQLKYKNQVLFDYVEQGGTVVVQYNTRHRLKTDKIAPYPIKLSRDRVTDEYSDVRFLQPDHVVLNHPNKITQEDFKNWVQERGLYFPSEWSIEYTPILSMNDKGSKPLDGSLLIAQHGQGYYVHTSLSFFRELPAGVTGAYRLLANLISIGQE